MAFIIMIFLFYHIYLWVEMILIAFLTTFSVKYLNFPVHNASLLISIFFGFHFVGRLLGIPLSTFFRPRTMVIVNLSMTVTAYLLLLAFVNVWPAIVWPSAALAGLSMATTFATGVLWIADRIPVTGRVSSVLLVGSASGGVIGPLFVGVMFDSSTPMWFVYALVAASLCHTVLFIGMMAFVGRCGNVLKPSEEVVGCRTESDEVVQVTFVEGDRREHAAVEVAAASAAESSFH